MREPSARRRRPDLSVVVVSHESANLLPDCLDSIRRTCSDLDCEVTLVDNRSEDGSADLVLRRYPEVRVISPPERSGFARNVNLGLAVSTGECIMIANPDTRLLDGCPQSLLRFLKTHPRVGIAAPRLFNPDGSVQLSCRRFHTPAALLLRRGPWAKRFANADPVRRFMMADWDHATVADVDWLIGGCLVVRRDALEDVGPLDERFFLYFEDVDWCMRMKMAGWRVCYVPHATAIHFHRQESAGSLLSPAARHHLRSLLRFLIKYRGRLAPPRCRLRS